MVAIVPLQGGVFDGLTDFFARFSFVFKLVRFVVAFVVIYLLGRVSVVPLSERLLRQNNRITPTVRQPLLRTVHVGVYFLAFFGGLFFARLQGLLAVTGGFAAALTLAVGFASRDVLGNLVSGLFIITDPKYNIGDWIEWIDENTNTGEGIIEDISFRRTRVRTITNELITVPNTTLANATVTNHDIRDPLRIKCEFGVEYGGDIDTIRDILIEEAEANPTVLTKPEPTALVETVTAAGIDFISLFWIENPSWQKYLSVRSAYFQAVKERFDREGIEMSPDLLEVMGDLGVDDSSAPSKSNPSGDTDWR
ncbi:MAG TPA: mechanosensitive ion channel family protein [Halococcus sp.]|nr:mechanosensitive ion channel family protein [Halococcus sp.]